MNDTRDMSDEEYNQLVAEIEYLSLNDPWFTFKRRGLQLDVFNAYENHKSGVFELFTSGPNQVGKSTSAQELLMDMLTRRNEYRLWDKNRPLQAIVICPKQTLQVTGFQRNFEQWNATFMKNNLTGRPTVKGSTGAWAALNFKNGDQVAFETGESKVEDLESFSGDLAIVEELNDRYDIYEFLTQRLIAKKGHYYQSMIPGSKNGELYTRVIGPHLKGEKSPYREVIMADRQHYVDANGEELANHYEKTLSRRLYNIKICGKWEGLGSLVYPNFEPKTHVIPDMIIPDTWARYVTIDWASSNNEGINDPRRKAKTAALYVAIPPPNVKVTLPGGREVISTDFEPIYFVYDEYSCDHRRLGREHANLIADKFYGKQIQEILIDCALEDQVFQEMREVFFKRGQGYRTYKATNKKRYSSEKMKQTLGHDLVNCIIDNNRLFVLQHCTGYVDEVLGYEIDPETQEAITFADHFCDAGRYLFNRFPIYKNPLYLLPSDDAEFINSPVRQKSFIPDNDYLRPRQEYMNRGRK